MRNLNHALKQLCRHCREGSYATQRNRKRMLTLMANELHGMGYRKMQARSIKTKHIEALVNRWQENNLSIGTIKNRMATLRWWAHKVDKQSVIARSNEHYGIPDRRFVTNESKAKDITQAQLNKVRDQHVRMSIHVVKGESWWRCTRRWRMHGSVSSGLILWAPVSTADPDTARHWRARSVCA